MKVSIIHPSRERPLRSATTIRSWINAATTSEIEVVLSLDIDDPSDYNPGLIPWTIITVNKNHGAVDAINNAAKRATGDIFIVVSDDTETLHGWDEKIIEKAKGHTDWIMKTSDGIQPWIITMPIMDRAYYNRFGYIYHPDYLHMFCDTDLSCVADLTGRKIDAPEIMLRHNHYSVNGGQPKDAVNTRSDATWNHGEKLFLKRYHRNFDLNPEDIKGKITDNAMINWLKRK